MLPPASFVHEQEKVNDRWPAAVRFIEERKLNEFFSEDADDIGIIVQGGSYNTLLRALERLGLADVYGNSQVPLYVMNVAYPVIESEVMRFCEGKRAVMIVEEGQPNFVEQNLATILRQAGSTTALHGKDMLPVAGEYTAAELLKGARTFCERYERLAPLPVPAPVRKVIPLKEVAAIGVDAAPEPAQPSTALGDSRPRPSAGLLHRLPRAAHLQRHEAGRARTRRAPRERRHRLPPVLHPAALQHRQHHHGLRPGRRRRRGAQRTRRQARDLDDGRRRLLAQRPHQRCRQRGVQQAATTSPSS